MKRSPLHRRSPLKQRAGLRRTGALARTARLSTHRKPPESNPSRDEFKTVRDGICRVCGKRGQVRRHHVVTEQEIRKQGGDPWDLRWGMWVGAFDDMCTCHRRHHNAVARIPFRIVPEHAIEVALELLGFDRAALYFARFYSESPRGDTPR